MNIIRKIYDLGFKNLEEGMAKKIERCHKIDWEALSPWEIQLYEDLMEFYC